MGKHSNNDLENQYEILISMLNLYLNEWMHRDKLFWERVFGMRIKLSSDRRTGKL